MIVFRIQNGPNQGQVHAHKNLSLQVILDGGQVTTFPSQSINGNSVDLLNFVKKHR